MFATYNTGVISPQMGFLVQLMDVAVEHSSGICNRFLMQAQLHSKGIHLFQAVMFTVFTLGMFHSVFQLSSDTASVFNVSVAVHALWLE